MARRHDAGRRRSRLTKLTALAVATVLSVNVVSAAGATPTGSTPQSPSDASCTPDAGYSDCVLISFTGNDQHFTVPTGVTRLQTKVWGAGGGGVDPGRHRRAPAPISGGGGGGFSSGTLIVEPGTSLTVVVGQGGRSGLSDGGSVLPTYGGGGPGGNGAGRLGDGSSGGGMSAIFAGSVARLVAGGGGGAFAGTGSDSMAGGGGGLAGGEDPDAEVSGRGGSQSGPGAAATALRCVVSGGGRYSGGRGGGALSNDHSNGTLGGGYYIEGNAPHLIGGGGGGGGYFGGGGGACQRGIDGSPGGSSAPGGAGGGGAGYVAGAGEIENGTTIAGSSGADGAAAGTAQSQYAAAGYRVGAGGSVARGSESIGGNGLVVMQWSRGYTVSKSVSVANTVPGGVVTYSVQVTNIGQSDYSAAAPAAFTDDLSGTLDDAAYNNDAVSDVGGWEFSGPGAGLDGLPLLHGAGPLAAHQTVTITYSVTVDPRGTGDGSMLNTVRPADSTGECLTPEACRTTTAVRYPRFVQYKVADKAYYSVGDAVRYAVTVANEGAVAGSAIVTDVVPVAIGRVSSICEATSGASCEQPVDGNEISSRVSLPPGGIARYTIVGIVTATGSATNAASVLATSAGCNAARCGGGIASTQVTPAVPVAVPIDCTFSSALYQSDTTDVTQLNTVGFSGDATATFTPLGGPSAAYSALGFDPVDGLLYAIGRTDDHLVRIDSTGAVADLGPLADLPAGSFRAGTFDAAGTMYIASLDAASLVKVNVHTRTTTTMPLSARMNVADFASMADSLWGYDGSAREFVRIDPVTGAVRTFASTLLPAGDGYEAAWSYGNGNLGLSGADGAQYQIAIADPASAKPEFSLQGSRSGPTATHSNGAACISRPVDLSLTQTSTGTAVAGDPLTWTLVVTNRSAATSSGHVLTDVLDARATDITTSSPGCSVQGTTVRCMGGPIAPGGSVSVQISGTAPQSPFTSALVAAATVTGNEADPDPSDDVANSAVAPGYLPFFVVTETADREAYLNGQSIEYTVTVTNTGIIGGTATVSGDLPAIVAHALVTCTTAPATASCDTAVSAGSHISASLSLGGGEQAVLHISATLAGVGVGDAGSEVELVPTTPRCASSCGGGTARTPSLAVIANPFFVATKTSDKFGYLVGDSITYTITITNAGAGAGSTSLSDDVVRNVEITGLSCTVTAGSSCDTSGSAGNAIRGNTTLLAAGAAVYTITGRILASGFVANLVVLDPTVTAGCALQCGGAAAGTGPVQARDQ